MGFKTIRGCRRYEAVAVEARSMSDVGVRGMANAHQQGSILRALFQHP